MPFLEQEYSEALRDELNLPDRSDTSSRPYSYLIYRHDRSNVVFYRQYSSDFRESHLTNTCLRIGIYSLKIIPNRKVFYRGGKGTDRLVSYTAESDIPLTKSLRARIRKFIKEIPLEPFDKKHRDFKAIIVDKTKPRKSRSIRKLVKFLNQYSASVYKLHLIYCQALFLSSISDDEIQLIHNHIYDTGGKGLTPMAILFFNLGVREKQNFVMGTLKKYPVSAYGPVITMSMIASEVEYKL